MYFDPSFNLQPQTQQNQKSAWLFWQCPHISWHGNFQTVWIQWTVFAEIHHYQSFMDP
jgi:hypothetical protein